MAEQIVPWREVAALEPVDGAVQSLLDTVDTLRAAWQRAVDMASPDEFAEARRRSLRRHAVETGIIERLYDVDWGVTQALVAEGLTLEAAQVHGSINPETLSMIRSQFDALEYLAEVARGRRPLSVQLVRELHQLITRHQATYTATDPLGNRVEAALRHGEWKPWPNHVRRPDGSLLQYAPPEQVEPQVQRLVELHGGMEGVHPVVLAAWLHHRFIWLVRLFSEREIVALRFELHQPVEAAAGSAVTVARAYVERIQRDRRARDEERRRWAEQLAGEVHERLTRHVEALAKELAGTFGEVDPAIEWRVDAAGPGDGRRSRWWRHQLIRAAREVNFWTNLARGTWWARIEIVVLGRTLRYVVAVQRVGDREVGVMAVTVFAEMPQRGADADEDAGFVPPVPLIRLSSTDSVTIVGGQSAGDVWPEVEALVDRTLAAAVHEYGSQLG